MISVNPLLFEIIKNNTTYNRPYNYEEIKKKYSEKLAKKLLSDPIHNWRMKTGIELIHKEPTLEEQKRIWENWQLMPKTFKNKSDKMSIKLFNLTNIEHHKKIMKEYNT
jgi:hypothetical protein